MTTDRFRGNPGATLGVELELQLVDARTMALKGVAGEVLAGLPDSLRDAVKPEFLQCYVEVTSDVCRTVSEVGADLAHKLRVVAETARRCGVRLAWGATHPFSHWRDQAITPDARYLELADLLQETVRRPATFGMHVHVGVDSGDGAVAVCNRVREHLPALLAFSANSPFWCGRSTGLHSHRVELLEGFPTGGLPPFCRDWDDYESLVGRLARCGFIKTEKELWWDVRPCRRNGTVEVRICDMPPDLPSVLGLSALIQCLVHDLARQQQPPAEDDPWLSLLVRQNRWRAARYGMGAELVDPRTSQAVSVRQHIRGLAESFRGTAEALGCGAHLARALLMAEVPNGAERQLAVYQQTGDLVEVTRRLVGGPADDSCLGVPDGYEAHFPEAYRAGTSTAQGPVFAANTRGPAF